MISEQPNWRIIFKEESAKKWRLNNVIIFLKEDIQKIQTLYDDAVIISTMIVNYNVKKF